MILLEEDAVDKKCKVIKLQIDKKEININEKTI